jgi:hypothetical protein
MPNSLFFLGENMKKLFILSLCALFLFNACLFDNSKSDKKTSKNNQVFYYGSDFQSGMLYALDYNSKVVSSELNLSQDTKIICLDGDVFALERTQADNITRIDGESFDVLYQKALPNGSNPSDLKSIGSNEALLALYNDAELKVINTKDGSITKSIDLKAYAAEGQPSANPNQILIHEDLIIISLERMKDWNPQNAILVLLSSSDLSIKDTIGLTGKNPNSMFIHQNDLIIAYKGTTVYDEEWNETSNGDGFIEKINLKDKSRQILIDEKGLGGKPSSIIFTGSKFFFSIYKSFGDQPVYQSTDLKTMSQIEGIEDAFGGIFYDKQDDVLWVGERKNGKSSLKKVIQGAVNESFGEDLLAPYSICR